MKTYLIIFGSVFLVLLGIYSRIKYIEPIRPPYVAMAQQVRADVAKTLSEKHDMNVIGIGGGMIDTVNVLGLSFQKLGPIPQDELRKIVVDCVEEFLAEINAKENLRPFLKNYPFTYNEIEIVIFVIDQSGISVKDPDFMIAAETYGTIKYKTKAKDVQFGYKNIIEEDYETALKLVQSEINSK